MNPNLPIIVGESNPYGSDPHYALYPEPEGCSGERLCYKVMGLRRGTYMSSFERVNLLQGPKWSAPMARAAALNLCSQCVETRTFVLLGRRVAAAFGYFDWHGLVWKPGTAFSPDLKFVVIPHPSGRNRVWSPGAVDTWRGALKAAMPNIPFGELDHPPLPKDVPHLFERDEPPGMELEVKFCDVRRG